MNPVLLNGDVILYKGVNPTKIANGTIIAYMPSATGVPALDYLVMPIVVHRVIGEVVQSDGTIYYRTKGDNNKFDDPGLVNSNQILGTPVTDVPFAGLFVEFLKSPQGLVFLIGAAVFLYMARFDVERNKEKNKKDLLAILARMSLNGEISLKQFEEFKIAIEYGEQLPVQFLKNPVYASLAEWMKSGGLSSEWKEEPAKCPNCLQTATMIRGTRDYFLLCPRCSDVDTSAVSANSTLRIDRMPEPFVKHTWNDGATRGAMALVVALGRLIRRRSRENSSEGS
jgi:signal peptidase I